MIIHLFHTHFGKHFLRPASAHFQKLPVSESLVKLPKNVSYSASVVLSVAFSKKFLNDVPYVYNLFMMVICSDNGLVLNFNFRASPHAIDSSLIHRFSS